VSEDTIKWCDLVTTVRRNLQLPYEENLLASGVTISSSRRHLFRADSKLVSVQRMGYMQFLPGVFSEVMSLIANLDGPMILEDRSTYSLILVGSTTTFISTLTYIFIQ
jgi:hypothetical protein